MNVPNQAQQLPLQQTQQDMLYGFAPPQNRSPGSQRDHLYGSAAAAGPAGFPSGLTMNRQAQRLQPFDPVSPLVPGHAYGMGIGAGGVDDQAAYGAAATSRFDRMQPPPGVPAGLNPAAYMMQNDQVWDQNAINTVNGAMNGTNRLRNVSRRAPLPNVSLSAPATMCWDGPPFGAELAL